MVLAFHGEAGGWDELLIALVAFGVLWVAVKLAGRKSAAQDEEDEHDEDVEEAEPGKRDADAAKPLG